ncbi:MAG: ATPase, partial [Planctomycetota bacterium]|nr:ATPase [Planctomycetota bacterium]
MPHPQERQIEIFIRARYPIIYVVSWEETRVAELMMEIGKRTRKKVYEWSCSTGIVPAGTPLQAQKHINAGTKDPLVALNEVVEQAEPAIYVFRDFHPFLARTNFAIIRRLRDIAQTLKSSYKTLILLSPFLCLPPDLEKDVTVVDFHLPSLADLDALLQRIIDEVKN